MIPAGFQKNSFIDYPGKISCVVFVSGCNFKCPYCHNPDLVTGKLPPSSLTIDDIFDFLKERKGFTDGVVITGGEPTLHESILQFCREVKSLGYQVKLDTNGTRPSFLKKLIDLSVVDYVAMDIKTDPSSYTPFFIERYAPEDILRSIRIIMTSAKDYEFRTTCVKPFVDPDIMIKICELIKDAKRYCLQKCNPTDVLDPDFFKTGGSPCEDKDLETLRTIAIESVQECIVR
jgi:pyruvate formate lyase activating enzyme